MNLNLYLKSRIRLEIKGQKFKWAKNTRTYNRIQPFSINYFSNKKYLFISIFTIFIKKTNGLISQNILKTMVQILN